MSEQEKIDYEKQYRHEFALDEIKENYEKIALLGIKYDIPFDKSNSIILAYLKKVDEDSDVLEIEKAIDIISKDYKLNKKLLASFIYNYKFNVSEIEYQVEPSDFDPPVQEDWDYR